MERHLLIGLMIPAAFLGFTGLVKSLIRRNVFWSNFYFGVDIALAALANCIVNIVDEVHEADPYVKKYSQFPVDFGEKMVYTAALLAISVGGLLFVMWVHQRWEEPEIDQNGSEHGKISNRRLARGIWLGIVSNVIGASALGVFIYWKLKGII